EPGTGAMAGDFYDLYPTSPTRLAAVIGDVAGRGIEPSITAFQVKYLLRVFLRQYRDPAQAVEELNAVLSSQGRPDELVSLCAVVFDQAGGTLRVASAGHPPAWHWHDGEGRPLRPTGPLLALDPHASATSRDVGLADGGAGDGSTADGADHLIGANRRALEGNLAKESEKLARQHELFVRDRLALLLDADSFVEDGLLANATAPGDDLPADGVVTGRGRVDGRAVCVMANDPTVKAGSWGARTVEKIVRLTEYALAHELPVVWLVDSAGARITDQVQLFPGRRGAGRIFYNQVRLSGRAPQVCCLFGPSAAGGAYIPSFCDVVFMVEGKASMIPDDERAGYDIHRIIDAVVDDGSVFEIKPLYAPELVVSLARLEGHPVGIVASNPAVKGGVLFVDSADKAARFIWCCDAYNVPLVFLADVPGFMIGTQVERQGIIRHGAKMITAVAEATVPKVCVVVRKAYGAGLYAMSGPAF